VLRLLVQDSRLVRFNHLPQRHLVKLRMLHRAIITASTLVHQIQKALAVPDFAMELVRCLRCLTFASKHEQRRLDPILLSMPRSRSTLLHDHLFIHEFLPDLDPTTEQQPKSVLLVDLEVQHHPRYLNVPTRHVLNVLDNIQANLLDVGGQYRRRNRIL
jgi:hypothetical protein